MANSLIRRSMNLYFFFTKACIEATGTRCVVKLTTYDYRMAWLMWTALPPSNLVVFRHR